MKTVIEMAREVNATAYTNRHYPDRTTYTFGPEQLQAFSELVRADEREACAKVCDARAAEYDGFSAEQNASEKLATSIRARGNT